MTTVIIHDGIAKIKNKDCKTQSYVNLLSSFSFSFLQPKFTPPVYIDVCGGLLAADII